MKQIFVVMSVPKFVKLSGDLRDTKIQNTAPVEVVVVFQLAAKQLLKRNYMQMYCFGLSMSVQKAVSMTCVYLKRVEFFFEKKLCIYIEDSLQLLQKLKYIVEDFSGDAEKFYSVFYDLLLDNLLPSKFEDETVTNILMTEAANHIIIHLSGGSDIVSLQPPSSKKSEHVLADRDFKSLQYIAGYIVHKMYTSFQITIKVIIVSKRCRF